jgi:protein N-terminal methyltransferase
LKGVEASVEGVLGGYGCVNDTDVKGSDAFLRTLLPLRFGEEKRHLVALGETSMCPCLILFILI